MNYAASGMLQCSGNMKTPSALNILMCPLDVVFNFLLIFPTRELTLMGADADGSGSGAWRDRGALGTAFAQLSVCFLMLGALLFQSPKLGLRRGEKLHLSKSVLKDGIANCLARRGGADFFQRSSGGADENCGASGNHFHRGEFFCSHGGEPLLYAGVRSRHSGDDHHWPEYRCRAKGSDKTARMAGNAFWHGDYGFQRSSYVPGSAGHDRNFDAGSGYPGMGTAVLRIEAFAEPLFAASMVVAGVFRGAGDTLVPSILNFVSMWLVRIPLAAFLAPPGRAYRCLDGHAWSSAFAEVCFC